MSNFVTATTSHRPFSLNHPLLSEVLWVSCGTLLIAALAQIQIPLHFSPVPITGQSLGVLVIGSLYGFRRGLLTCLSYLGLGVAGLPFFAKASGVTAGYLVGFLVATAVMGWISDNFKWDKKLSSAIALFCIGHVCIFACGIIGLLFWFPPSLVLSMGLWPFLPGAIIKTALAAVITSTIQKGMSSI